MKNHKKIIIIVTILIILISSISLIISSIIKDKKETTKNIELIKYNSEQLNENVLEYNEIRKELSAKLNNFMYDKFIDDKEKYEEILVKYNKNIEKIDNNIKNIDDRCKVIYNDKDINNICNNYKINYEKLINLYVSDINIYNQKIVSYNEYKSENIELFKLIHNDYIDYNQDDRHEGIDTNEIG